MTRDIFDRIRMFIGEIRLERLALNIEQVEQYSPPPNPAKITDSRYVKYAEIYGTESWELDALDPSTLADLVKKAVLHFRDEDIWQKSIEQEQGGREKLQAIII